MVPKSSIVKHPVIKDIQAYGFDDARVGKIARDFAVSKQVILHCLWELNIISQPFYYETLNRYSDEYKAYKAQKSKKVFFLQSPILEHKLENYMQRPYSMLTMQRR